MISRAVKRPRVLKLGWEFPPLINGGLGVACLGLSRALAKHADLRVVVPRAAPEVKYDGFRLTGLNNLGAKDLRPTEDKYRYESFAEIKRVPIPLDPYASDETKVEKVSREPDALRKPNNLCEPDEPQEPDDEIPLSQTTKNQLEIFKKGDLYGGDLGAKVIEFSKVAAQLAMKWDFDIIHAHDWITFLAGIEVKKATGKPLVVHVHASQYDRAGADDRGWIYEIEKYGMQEADRVIPVSRYTGEICAGHYGINRRKIRPIHNGADPVRVFQTEKAFPEKLVLFLGRLTAQKGPEFFLEIAGKVLKSNKNVRFVMAGTGERLKPLLESSAFRGLGGRMHVTGFLNKDKVNELLSMTDVYCMPSVSEPFGLSALEAAQFGIPAVISRQSGVAEVLKGALTSDYWDTDRMAGHINALLTDDQLREQIVKQAASDIQASTWDAAAEKVVAVYRELLS